MKRETLSSQCAEFCEAASTLGRAIGIPQFLTACIVKLDRALRLVGLAS